MSITALALRLLLPLAAALAIFFAGGCGGGTSGTGIDDSGFESTAAENSRTVSGVITRADGSPVEGAIVRSVASGQEAMTASDGVFALEVPDTGEPFVIEVLIGDRMAIVQFDSNLQQEGAIELQITVDEENGIAQVEVSQSGAVSLFSEVPVETSVKEILL